VTDRHKMQKPLDWFKTHWSIQRCQRMLMANSNFLSCSGEFKLQPTFESVQAHLQFNETQTAKLFFKCPRLLKYNFNNTVKPRMERLQDILHLDRKKMRSMIRNNPQTIQMTPEHLTERVEWSRKRLELDDEDLGRFFYQATAVFGMSEEILEQKLSWLQKELHFASTTELTHFLLKMPSLLSKSLSGNLEPTLQFFKEHLGEEVALKMVRAYPRMFNASLEGRLKPRAEVAMKAGVNIDSTLMRKMACWTEKQWQSMMSDVTTH